MVIELPLCLVVIQGSSSNCLPVVSGVPQGSVLGPFLFLLYINELSSVVSSGSNLALIADDSKCFRKISTLEDGLNFQQDISAIKEWGDSWGMPFNSTKCKILGISRSFNPVIRPYQMGNILIGPVDSYRDLGFTVTKDLSCKVRIDSVTKKANRSLSFINRTVGSKLPCKLKSYFMFQWYEESWKLGSLSGLPFIKRTW